MGRLTVRRPVLRVRPGSPPRHRPDTLVVEEPLEIRVDGNPLAVTMRTPGHDIELALGFLVSEGLVRDASDVKAARYCSDVVDGADDNVVDVTVVPAVKEHVQHLVRNVTITSACGVCGRTSLDTVRTGSPYDITSDPVTTTTQLLATLPETLRSRQNVFERTGGLHAVGVFTPGGELIVLREDVGRHNAFDKVVGWALQQSSLPLSGLLALVSGRASFELVQKAALAGLPVLAAVSAPSTLAVDLADEVGMTLVGFLRGESMNIYTQAQRVVALG
ncbi:MAG: formate dehydrogenase accessory sulfurtransferase FdhD [Candidatus Nanopelagicales bacterium]